MTDTVSSEREYGLWTAESMPLYKRVKLDVTRTLSSGEIDPNEPLPTERELATRYGVSIGTVRRAMDELVAEHIVVRQQGRGTFLLPLSADRLLNRFWLICRHDGERNIPIVQTLTFETKMADEDIGASLKLKPKSSIHHIVNLLLIGGEPVILDDVNIPASMFQGLTQKEFISRDTAMYELYQSQYGVSVIQTLDRLHAIEAPSPVASHLGISPFTPILLVDRLAYTFHDTPVERRRSYLNTKHYEYRNAIGR